MRYRISSFIFGWLIGILSSTFVRRRLSRFIFRYAPDHLYRQIEEKRSEVTQSIQRLTKEFKISTAQDSQKKNR